MSFPGAVVRAYGRTKANRPGIVLRELPDGSLYVAFGTTVKPILGVEKQSCCYGKWSQHFERLGLTGTTWFRPGYGERVSPVTGSMRVCGQCPDEVFRAVRTMYGFR